MTEKPERPCSPRDLMARHSEWLHFGVDSQQPDDRRRSHDARQAGKSPQT
ncbi:hypothetical protein [Acidovorax sp. Root217]|nr:hypothetical protein [Acidovorax sp. Root217]